MSDFERIKSQIKRQLANMSNEQRQEWVDQTFRDPQFTNWLSQGLNQKKFTEDE